ncbi:hypothetical protein CDL60_15480 [Roseateles noduli]|nr:hypothetical protein CDL60_15480 [Roseateles noduli]
MPEATSIGQPAIGEGGVWGAACGLGKAPGAALACTEEDGGAVCADAGPATARPINANDETARRRKDMVFR